MSSDWDDFFLGMAQYVSRKSKDPSTKTGAVIVRPNKTIASMGFNGFPRNMPDTPALYEDREEKYDRIVHCEMNAVLFAREPLDGCILYTYPFLSCSRCFQHMIQAGIVRFVAPKPTSDQITRWGVSFEKTRTYAKEAGVELIELDYKPLWTRTS